MQHQLTVRAADQRPAVTDGGKPDDEIRYCVNSLRAGAKALRRHIRDRWSIENSWHRVRHVPLRQDTHRYREDNGH